MKKGASNGKTRQTKTARRTEARATAHAVRPAVPKGSQTAKSRAEAKPGKAYRSNNAKARPKAKPDLPFLEPDAAEPELSAQDRVLIICLFAFLVIFGFILGRAWSW